MDKFPARMFRWAAIYGVIVLVPLYLTPLPKAGAAVQLALLELELGGGLVRHAGGRVSRA